MGVPPATAEAKIMREINYLKDRIEQYKQRQKTLNIMQSNEENSSNRNMGNVKPKVLAVKTSFCDFSTNSEILSQKSTENTHVNSQLRMTKVHVNPNFKRQVPTVHINPNICTKPLIHVNPRIIHDIANSNQNLQNNISTINVNSLTMNTTNMSIAKTNTDNYIKQASVKKSIYVNPTLLKKLSSPSKEKSTNLKELTEPLVCSRLKFVRNIDNQKNSPKRAHNSSIVLLSRRKLVRVTRTTKGTPGIPTSQYRLRKSNLTERKCETVSQKMKIKSLLTNTLHSTSTRSDIPKLGINRSINKSKVTKYKIDRTTLSTSKARKTALLVKKAANNTSKFVTIAGVVYKSSKTKLIRNNCTFKRKRSISGKDDKLTIDKRRRICKETLHRTLEVNSKSKIRLPSSTPVKANYKNSISNKAKQRSIRILQNKMHKNNQPCLIFQRFGSCPNHENGICLKRHDKKQVSLCKKFLQGKCFLDKCPLSHDIGPEKMPTCKYFLDGCCTRDNCPYLHVKVSANTSICIDFLQGYCAKGNKCQRRHEYLCPEYNKSGSCSKGECCPYPHKSHSFNYEKSSKYLNKIHGAKKHQATTSTAKDDSETTNPESRLRYYEISSSLSEDPEKRKITASNSVKQMQINEKTKTVVKENEHESEMMTCHHNNRKKQISINSYIPIDPS
ncbi:Zinc finger CCCH domain-containing protein [Ooceraea biroi]|uniref:Zinc finger CCCH domain-containing protein n=1 Tax=Ooceraea biroi TaxID=2015173 RepID=A0A026WME4_OOCBI|nr:Zinc finger CCCH domain-containing protein [Ooceraea biroi]